MSLDRGQDVVIENVEEDDMPPLVDTPNPTYTFFSGMSSHSFTSTSAPTATQDVSPQPSTSLFFSPPESPTTPDESTSTFSMPVTHSRPHGKRRDPSYIPRPPNAFILFRCAFIKEQNVPGKVEGNHSLCWKQLSPEEREKWEAKAVLAQAEHRAHYPDWRFRPGANALAKLKVKDGGGNNAPARRRSVRSRAKDSPAMDDAEDDDFVSSDIKGKGKEKGRGKTKSTRIISLEETRCAKIAGFVAEGIKGEELEVAVKEWEGDHRIPKSSTRPPKTKTRGGQGPSSAPAHIRSRSDATFRSPMRSTEHVPEIFPADRIPAHSQHSPTPIDSSAKLEMSENITSVDPSPSTVLSDVPLTHMFKRSLSAPASHKRLSNSHPPSELSDSDDLSSPVEPSPGTWGTFKPLVLPEAPTRINTHSRHDTISSPMPSSSSSGTFDSPHHLTWQEAENQRRLEAIQGPDSWWTQRTIEPHFSYGEPTEQRSPISMSTDNMGYDAPQGGSQFDRGYLEQYRSFDPAQDGSQRVEWTDMSSNNRQGLVTVIEDPYKDDCDDNSPCSAPSIPTLSLPPLSSSSYYQSHMPPPTPPSFPSTSFSTLTGWAGDYKFQPSETKNWPSNHLPTPTSSFSSDSSSWYSNANTMSWGTNHSELQHPHPSTDSDDWDRLEYRAASNLHLPVEPVRQLNFLDELNRMHGHST